MENDFCELQLYFRVRCRHTVKGATIFPLLLLIVNLPFWWNYEDTQKFQRLLKSKIITLLFGSFWSDYTAQKMKFSIKDFFIFCAVLVITDTENENRVVL